MFQKQNILEDILILCVDLFCIIISLVGAYFLRYGDQAMSYFHGDAKWVIAGICTIYVFIAIFMDLYHHFFRRGYIEEFISVIKSLAITIIIFIIILYLTRLSSSFARLVFGYFVVGGTVIVYLGRICLKKFMLLYYKKSKFSNRLILITTSDKVKEIIAHLYERNDWNRILTGIILTDTSANNAETNMRSSLQTFLRAPTACWLIL